VTGIVIHCIGYTCIG